jgi:hypothetical protein
MWIPWRNKTGLTKAAAVLATILSIATISCGLNFALAVTTINSDHGINVLLVTAYIELAAMAGSAIGLLVVLVVWLIRKMHVSTVD